MAKPVCPNCRCVHFQDQGFPVAVCVGCKETYRFSVKCDFCGAIKENETVYCILDSEETWLDAPAHICGECVGTLARIIEEQKGKRDGPK